MRIKHRYCSVHKNEQLLSDLRALDIPFRFDDVDPRTSINLSFLEFFLYEDDPEYHERKAHFAQYSDDLIIWEATEFLPEEVESASWFMMDTMGGFGYPQPEDDFQYLNITFDMSNACPVCTIGKIQIAPFRFKTTPKAKHSALFGLNWVPFEIFVRSQASDLWLAEHFTGVRFNAPVLHKTGQPLEGLLQAHVDATLPPGVSLQNLVAESCRFPISSCTSERYLLPTRGALTFPAELFNEQPDFVRTFEWFGSGGESYRPIIVSKRVRDSALKHRLRGARFTPVFLT